MDTFFQYNNTLEVSLFKIITCNITFPWSMIQTCITSVAHLYQMGTPFFSTFQLFFKLDFNQVMRKSKTFNQFNFFFHIDKKIIENVILIDWKSNNQIFKIELYFKCKIVNDKMTQLNMMSSKYIIIITGDFFTCGYSWTNIWRKCELVTYGKKRI